MTKKERFNRLSEMGCIVCKLYYSVYTAPEIHHLTGLKYRSTGKKANDDNTIGLCLNHHRQGDLNNPSVHARPAKFTEMYGSQEDLLKLTNELL